MLDLFAFREFREGLAMMRDGEAEKAMTLLRQAVERDPENPVLSLLLRFKSGLR